MITLLVVAAVCGYAFIGGMFGWYFKATSVQRCADCQDKRQFHSCYSDHGMAAIFAGAFWPVMLPASAGGLVANYFTTREARATRKAAQKDTDHQRRLAEIEAERELAREQKEKTLADIRFLAENGIHAEVPGLYDGGA